MADCIHATIYKLRMSSSWKNPLTSLMHTHGVSQAAERESQHRGVLQSGGCRLSLADLASQQGRYYEQRMSSSEALAEMEEAEAAERELEEVLFLPSHALDLSLTVCQVCDADACYKASCNSPASECYLHCSSMEEAEAAELRA